MKKKYGLTFGSFVLGSPDVVSFDLDILRQILVKDTNKFEDVVFVDFVKSPVEWKRMRNLIHPKFATMKLHQFMNLFNQTAKELCDYLENFAKNSKNIHLKETFARHAFNSFAPSKSYDMGESMFEGEESKILKKFNEIFIAPYLFHTNILFQYFFPNLETLIRTLSKSQMMIQPMREFLLRVLKMNPTLDDIDPNNLVQGILKTMLHTTLEQNGKHISKEMNNKISTKISNFDQGIAPFEMIVQFFVSTLSGQEAIAYVMQSFIYVLAKMPEIQNKVREEIFEVMGDRKEVEFDDIGKLKYLYQVLQETLRMYPTNPRTNRVCTVPVTIKDVHFEPGCVFSVPIYAMHHDERFYPDPFKFDPDRWLPEEKAKRDPLTFLPFGYGPHSCIGNRFAEFQSRTTIVHLLTNFEFIPVSGSPNLPLRLNTLGLVHPYENLYVQVRKI